MKIVFQYKKKRINFGRRVHTFGIRTATVLVDLKPEPERADKYIEVYPCHKAVQAISESSLAETNTETKELKHQGMLHLEGGWPKDVVITEPDSKARYQKKEEKQEKYIRSLKATVIPMEHYLSQNIALDIYENYFPEKTYPYSTVLKSATATPTATVLTVFKDPCTKQKRIASNLSFFPTDGKKIAVAYYSRHYSENADLDSFIWDIHNPNVPEMKLSPTSCLTCIQYNPKETPYIVGGAQNGSMFIFDCRRGSQPVDYSHMEYSHTDPVYSVRWLQTKSSTDCVSVSTDGLVLVWDIRNLGRPIETHSLDLKPSKQQSGYSGFLGALCSNYDPTYSSAKLLIGTEQGLVVSWNRKTKKKDKQIEKVYTGHHGSIYAVQRNPFFNKYFLTVGDWCARIWNEENKTSILETKYEESYLTSGCWSPTRPGVFYTIKMDGSLDVWDLLNNHNRPLVSVKLASEGLYSIESFNGKYLGVGSADGCVNYVELSDDLSGFLDSEKQSMNEEKILIQAMLERESKRERTLETQRVSMKQNLDKSKAQSSQSANNNEQEKTSASLILEMNEKEIEMITSEYFDVLNREDEEHVSESRRDNEEN